MIKHYRKKPVVIEAVQWTGDNWNELMELGCACSQTKDNKTNNSRGSQRKCKNSRGKTDKRNESKRTRIRTSRKKNDIRCDTRRCRFYVKIRILKKERRKIKDRKSTRLNSSHSAKSRMPSSA